MKKILFIIAVMIGFYGCGPSKAEILAHPEKYGKSYQNSISFGYYSDGYSIVKIGNCEYLKGWAESGDGGPYLTHKGDCSNPIHIYKTDSL